MKTVLKTAPTAYPVSLSEIKQQLNIVDGWTEDDALLQEDRYAAVEDVEGSLRRKLITQTWYAYYDAWPRCDAIVLPFGQLQSVATIKYTETDGTQTTWSDTEYNVDIKQDPGRVVLEYGYPWPSYDLHPMNPIEIEFVCGYGDTGADVRPGIKHGIKMMATNLYENRGDVVIGTISSNLKIMENLIFKYKIHGLPT